MEEIYTKLAASAEGFAALTFDSTARHTTVYEVWLRNETGQVEPNFEEVPFDILGNWLSSRSSAYGRADCTLLLQLAVVPTLATSKTVKITKDAHKTLLDNFQLQLAYKYIKSTITSITAFPKASPEPGVERRCYAFNYAPKLAAVWSQVQHSGDDAASQRTLTQGILYIDDPSLEKTVNRTRDTDQSAPPPSSRQIMTRLMHSTWHADLYLTGMVPALLLAMQLGFEIEITQTKFRNKIAGIERKTEYHTFESRRKSTEQPSDYQQLQNLRGLAVDASGSATKLASVDRKNVSIKKLLQFIENELNTIYHDGKDGRLQASKDMLMHHVRVLQDRREMQDLNNKYIMKRAEIQITAVFNMMAHHDNKNSIDLATSTHQISKASYRDASSMKTLAIVTMFFLPGSFVSALFSMPMFDWDKAKSAPRSIGVALLPQFSLYWVITLPLTIATFCLYFIWLWYLKRERVQEGEIVSNDKKSDNSDVEKAPTQSQETRWPNLRQATI